MNLRERIAMLTVLAGAYARVEGDKIAEQLM